MANRGVTVRVSPGCKRNRGFTTEFDEQLPLKIVGGQSRFEAIQTTFRQELSKKAQRGCRGTNESKKLLVALLGLAGWLPAQAQTPTIGQIVNAATGRCASSVPVAARGSLI